ncbi:MAG: protein kinase [Planctomycetia bacterium]|nr:protein kinase [Planctomycetia bacterium]
MGVKVQEFWQLLVASGLYDEEGCRRLSDAYANVKHAATEGTKPPSLLDWLVSTRALSRYQAKVLLAGKPGPFSYGDFTVHDHCRTGRLAGLFRAVHGPTKCPVILRFLAGPAVVEPKCAAALDRRARAAAALTAATPHLARFFGVVDHEGYKFCVVENLVGQSLAERLAAGAAIPADEALRVVWQVAQALRAVHAAGLVHGAIRPNQIWLSTDGSAKLIDFPLACDPLSIDTVIVSDHTWQPEELEYLAPECVGGKAPTLAADIYSLGRVLKRLLAANDGKSRLLDQVNPAASGPLAAIVSRMLAEQPSIRFADAAAMAEALSPHIPPADRDRPPPGQLPREEALGKWFDAATPTPTLAPSAAPGPGAVALAAEEMAAAPVIARRPASRRRHLVPVLAGIAAALVVLVSGVAVLFWSNSAKRVTSEAPVVQTRGPTATADLADNAGTPSGNAAPDVQEPPARTAAKAPAADGAVALSGTMWASPTQGAPLDLAYMPPGAEVIVALRPAELLRHAEGAKLLDPRTIGPMAQWFNGDLAAAAGVPLAEIEQALVAILNSADGRPRVALVVHLREPAAEESLLTAWGSPQPKEQQGVKFHAKGDRAYFLPAAAAGRTIVIGPADVIATDIIPAADAAPALRREMELLLATSDGDRHLTILAAPNVLSTGGDAWWPGTLARLRTALDWLLSGHDPGAAAAGKPSPDGAAAEQREVDLSSQGMPKAVLASFHLLDEDLFLEVRVAAEAARPTTLAEQYADRMAGLPRRVSDYLRTLALSDYSRDVLWEFPRMVEQLQRYTVTGTDRRQVVLRAYLPVVAAHNLALGSYLAVIELPRPAGAPGGRPAAGPVPATPAAEPLATRLTRKMSLVFDRNALEKALQLVGEEVGAEVVILGSDLQVEGITKNKSFALAERDQPAEEILRKIMLLASPDGKLVYVIKPKEGTAQEALYITTRAAARERGESLPEALREK